MVSSTTPRPGAKWPPTRLTTSISRSRMSCASSGSSSRLSRRRSCGDVIRSKRGTTASFTSETSNDDASTPTTTRGQPPRGRAPARTARPSARPLRGEARERLELRTPDPRAAKRRDGGVRLLPGPLPGRSDAEQRGKRRLAEDLVPARGLAEVGRARGHIEQVVGDLEREAER